MPSVARMVERRRAEKIIRPMAEPRVFAKATVNEPLRDRASGGESVLIKLTLNFYLLKNMSNGVESELGQREALNGFYEKDRASVRSILDLRGKLNFIEAFQRLKELVGILGGKLEMAKAIPTEIKKPEGQGFSIDLWSASFDLTDVLILRKDEKIAIIKPILTSETFMVDLYDSESGDFLRSGNDLAISELGSMISR